MAATLEDTIELTGSTWPEVFGKLDNLLTRMFRPLSQPQLTRDQWQPMVNVLQDLHEQYFVTQTDPTGVSWQPLSAYTIAKKGHAKILIEDGDLVASLTSSSHSMAVREFTPGEIVFGTNRPWAGAHQDGAGRIPQRQHTGVGVQNLQYVSNVIADAMVQLVFDVRA